MRKDNGRKRRPVTDEVGAVVVTEGVAGTHFYHLSPWGDTSISLCGVRTMGTLIPVEAWGEVSHLQERYCRRCEAEAEKKKKA